MGQHGVDKTFTILKRKFIGLTWVWRYSKCKLYLQVKSKIMPHYCNINYDETKKQKERA